MAVSSAAVVNQININSYTSSVVDTTILPVTSNTITKNVAKIKSGASQNLKSAKHKAAGAPLLVNGLTLAQMNDGISRAQKFFNTNGRLPNFISYGTNKIPIAQFQQIIATQGFTLVNGLTLAQMNDGISRAQNFINSNSRLPNFISYGTNKIPIAEFQLIIATQGLKINGISVNVGKPIYITSDNIINSATDNARINSIINGLKLLGLNAYNMGLGPNTHVQVLKSSQVPKNALIVDIYGGADAGTLYEMGLSWYKSLKGTKSVFTVFWPPAKVITGLPFLERAHDDNYDPASFTGLAHPDQYLLNNGYKYLYSGDITNIINAIFYQATH